MLAFAGTVQRRKPVKVSQIAKDASYEDKGVVSIRTVIAIYGSKEIDRSTVVYIECPASKSLYRHLQPQKSMPLTEFAKWAARPAGTKKLLSEKKFMDWVRGPTDRLVKSR